MKAMVLAAGLGTRLRPLTSDRPKALIEVAGRTMLEITLARLRSFGIEDVIINVHHFDDQVVDYLEARRYFGMRIAISREETLLDTGGGLQKAGYFFREDGDGEPFILHNVDVISTIDLRRMAAAHRERKALATLAVRDRSTSRYLLFDADANLCGRRSGADGEPELVRGTTFARALAFSGIHVISPRLFSRLQESGTFSIIAAYLRLAAEGETIAAFDADAYYWRDLGRLADVQQAARDIESGLV